MVRFALIQLAKKHTEILGTFYEIILKNKWDLTVFFDLEDDNYTFIPYYNKLFNYTIPIRKGRDFESEMDNFDFLIFASSSDDCRFQEYMRNPNISHKCIFVHHQAIHIKPYMIRNISVTPLVTNDHLNSTVSQYILPVYKSYKAIHWKPISNKVIFAVIGAIRGVNSGKTVDRDLNLVQEVLNAYPEGNYEFWFFMRKNDWAWIARKHKWLRENKRVVAFPGLKTENMIKVLHQAKFILPLAKKKGWFYWERLTGSIPLAVNFNIPLLIDRELAAIYGLQDCSMCYENSILEIYENLIKMSDDNYYQYIVKIVKYKKDICKQNEKNFFDICMRQIIGKHVVNYFDNLHAKNAANLPEPRQNNNDQRRGFFFR